MNPWLVLWAASGLVQVAGLAMACWYGWQAVLAGWRWFWLVFAVNWLFTLAHQLLWAAATDLEAPWGFLQALAKLGAMLAEIIVMQVGHDLERPGEGRY